MSSEPFLEPENATQNILELIKYLSDTDNGGFIYRGQIKRYGGPLLPSAFRGILQDNPVISENDKDIVHSMRKVGRRFNGNFVWDREDYHHKAMRNLTGSSPSLHQIAEGTLRDADAYFKTHFKSEGSFATLVQQSNTELENFLRSTTSTIEFNSLSEKHGCRQAVSSMIREAFPSLDSNHPYLHKYVDDYHLHRFYTDILVNSFGYLLGSLVSQHYGFSSGFLDATTSIDIAAFFATHAAPDYKFLGTSGNSEIGVIYRISDLTPNLEIIRLCDIEYETARGAVTTCNLLRQLEDDVSVAQSFEAIRGCFEFRTRLHETIGGFVLPPLRRYDLLKLPRGAISSSRIGRQMSAVVVPDEIHKAVKIGYRGHPLTGKIVIDGASTVLCQQSVEDIHYRKDVRCFYFRHSNINPCPDITPSYLWPNEEDFFLVAIAFLFDSGFNFFLTPGYILPRRIDLIDPGYGNILKEGLLARMERSIHGEKDNISQHTIENILDSPEEKQLYRVYKAATLSYQGHVTGDGSAIESAFSFCRHARQYDPTNITLVALEMLLYEAMAKMSEVGKLRDEAVKMVEKEYSAKGIEGLGYNSSFELYMCEYYYKLYQWRFRADFAFLLYEMYQTS